MMKTSMSQPAIGPSTGMVAIWIGTSTPLGILPVLRKSSWR